jgi:carbon storage regulator
MLVLSRHRGSAIQIGADVTVTVLELHKRQVKLGIRAPNEVSIQRVELLAPTVPAIPMPPPLACYRRRPMRPR